MYVHAQLNPSGEDPGRIKWSYIESDNFQIIYPQGTDSLALKYGRLLEKYRMPASVETGLVPRRIPVILHTENASADIVSRIAPRRIEIAVRPQGTHFFSHPIEEISSIYAARLASHSEFGFTNALRPFTWFFGEMSAGGAKILYPNKWMIHGDAISATTNLISGGFGRYGEFINYYMAAFCEGETRGKSWDRWMIGSFRDYTPDDRCLGYLIFNALSNIYDNPFYMKDFFSYYSRRPYDIFVSNAVDRKFTGGSTIKHIFPQIIDYHKTNWDKELEQRKPFTRSFPATSSSNGQYTDYKHNTTDSKGNVYTIKSGMDKCPALICVSPDGKERRLTYFDSQTGRLSYSESLHRLFWSEKENDIRWKQKIYNTVYFYDLKKRHKRKLTKAGNLFNPSVSADGSTVSAISGQSDGKTQILIIDASNGKTLFTVPPPTPETAVTEACIGKDSLYCSTVSASGTSIYSISSDDFKNGRHKWNLRLNVNKHSVRNLIARDDFLYFDCDMSGVFNLYSFDLKNNLTHQKTEEKYGARDFCLNGKTSDTLFYSRMTTLGYELRKIPSDSLFSKAVVFDEDNGPAAEEKDEECADSLFSEPKTYSKGKNLFRIHSWAPVYFDSDNVMSLSGDHVYDIISIGATALTQNTLSTACGSVGYSWHPDPDKNGWVHGGHIKFRYSGWYPVIEGNLRINDKVAYKYHISNNNEITAEKRNIPSVTGELKVSVPLTKENGGHSYGFLPMGIWSLNNDLIDGILNHNFTLITRMWWMKDKAKAEVYPRFGVGMSTGFKFVAIRNDHSIKLKLNNTWQAYFYGYLPGFMRCQGLKLTLLYQTKLNKGIYNPISDILPRGMKKTFIENISTPARAAKITADYVIPINVGDVNITPIFYLNRILITPHFDLTLTFRPEERHYSAGASVTLQLGRLIWSFALFEIGIDYSYNGGTLMNRLEKEGTGVLRHYLGPVFKVNL